MVQEEVKGNEEIQPEVDRILDLDELVEPAGQFRVGGILYDFVEFGTLGILDQRKIEKKWELLQKIRKSEKPDKGKKPADLQRDYLESVQGLIPLVSTMPKDTARNIPVQKLMQALICFFSFRTASQVALVVRMSEIATGKPLSIGGNLSPESIAFGLKQTQESG